MISEKIKTLISKEGKGNNKRKIENLVVFIIILIITIIAINSIWNDKKDTKEERTDVEYGKQLAITNQVKVEEKTSTSSIEENLENILSQIDGVGKVKVLVTYSETSEVVAMYNESSKNSTIEEKDSGRGNKNDPAARYNKRYNISRRKWRKNTNNTKNNKSQSRRSNNNSSAEQMMLQ